MKRDRPADEQKKILLLLAEPSKERLHYPDQPLPVDNYPSLIVYDCGNININISDIRTGNNLESVLFGRVTITETKDFTENTRLQREDAEFDVLNGESVSTEGYVPLLEETDIISYLLSDQPQEVVDEYMTKWFAHLQDALEPCNEYTLSCGHVNNDTFEDLLEQVPEETKPVLRLQEKKGLSTEDIAQRLYVMGFADSVKKGILIGHAQDKTYN